MVKEFLIAHPLVKILGKNMSSCRKISFFQKPKNIPSSKKNEGVGVIQS